MEFPYGKAPFWILVLAVVTGIGLLAARVTKPRRPDLILQTFAKDHIPGHEAAAKAFEEKTGKRVEIQLVNQDSLYRRLFAAMQSGAEQPDLVECLEGSMGTFTRGPLDAIGFVDLTDRVHSEGWWDKLVNTRFSLWSSRGHIFAIPHDVHPVMLAYRKDLTDKLGIDVTKLKTWDDFAKAGREITKDLDGDGTPDRYMIDMQSDGGDHLQIVMLQAGARVLDEAGKVTFDSPLAADIVEWYIHQCAGKDRIAFPCGWGQPLAKAMNDGLVLFYFTPDWRTKQFENDVLGVSGKMGLCPLPVWGDGKLVTSTWGATGLAITKACKEPDLAWEFAKFVYYNPADLPKRYLSNNILPPVKASWSMPEMKEPDPYFSGQVRGEAYAALAPLVPSKYLTANSKLASGKLSEAYLNSLAYFNSNGDHGLKEFITKELHRTAEQVRVQIDRNRFQNDGKAPPTVAQAAAELKGVSK